MRVAIIDCGAGNLHSVQKAFARVMPAEATLEVVIDSERLSNVTHIVLPGVGAFGDCMAGLNALPGMRDALERYVRYGTTPFFGICVGMQMLFQRGHEHGTHDGLGWFDGEVRRIAPSDPGLRIPHMGWNRLRLRHESPILNHLHTGDFAYFVHSFAARDVPDQEVLATTEYGGDIVALVGRGHILGSQFHPEKSQTTGLTLIRNFLEKA